VQPDSMRVVQPDYNQNFSEGSFSCSVLLARHGSVCSLNLTCIDLGGGGRLVPIIDWIGLSTMPAEKCCSACKSNTISTNYLAPPIYFCIYLTWIYYSYIRVKCIGKLSFPDSWLFGYFFSKAYPYSIKA